MVKLKNCLKNNKISEAPRKIGVSGKNKIISIDVLIIGHALDKTIKENYINFCFLSNSMENISQWFAREFLGERQGRSVSKITADNLGISVNGVHFIMFLGVALYLNSKEK